MFDIDINTKGYYECILSTPVRLVSVNEDLSKMLGYTQDEQKSLFGDSYAKMIHSEDRDSYYEMTDRLSREEGMQNVTYRMNRKDGTFVFVLDTMISVMQDGVMKGRSFVIDIDDAIGLDKNARALKDFITRGGALTFEYLTKDQCLVTSSELDEYLGYTPPAKWLHKIHERKQLHPEFDFHKLLNMYNQVMLTLEPQSVELKFNVKDKGERWIIVAMAPIFDSDESVSGLFGIVQDSTKTHKEHEILSAEIELIHSAVRKKFPVAISLNFTKNSYKIIIGKTYLNIFEHDEGELNELLDAAVNALPAKQRDEFSDAMSIERILQEHEAGKNTIVYEYNEESDKPEDSVRFLFELSFFDIGDNDLMALFMLEDVTAVKEIGEKAGPNDKEVNGAENRKVRIRTFGYFDVFVGDKPVLFNNEKAKEMLAVLVDRKGGFVGTDEMLGYLWEGETPDVNAKAKCRQTASRMNRTLAEYGIGEIVENINGKRRIIPENVTCDLFEYMDDRARNQGLFNGNYMSGYGWGEYTLAALENGVYNFSGGQAKMTLCQYRW